MKNKHFFFYCILLFFAAICSGCTEKATNNRIYFSIDQGNRHILIPVQLNDSVTANLTFDTGWYDDALFLDSSFVAAHPTIAPEVLPDTGKSGSAWSDSGVRNLIYDTPKTIKIGDIDGFTYNVTCIMNWKKAIHSDVSEGVFNIPKHDTTHVWELNFDHNYLEIHSADKFNMPKNCYLFPLDEGPLYSITLPFQVSCANGDTISIKRSFFIDSGMSWDFVLMHPAEEISFFHKQENAVWTCYRDSYFRHYSVNALLFDSLAIDSLRVYTFDNSFRVRLQYLVGLNFLKRFNVFFDRKNRRVGLQPIKNFQRIVNPNYRRFHYSTLQTTDGRFIVNNVADYEENYFKTAGLCVGDEVTAVNDTLYKNISYMQKMNFCKQDSLVFDIIRNKKRMRIIIPVDKTEIQGD